MEHADALAVKVAVLTGAGNGIGRVTALTFARRSAAVVGIDQDAMGLTATASEIEAAGCAAVAPPTELSDPASISFLATKPMPTAHYRRERRGGTRTSPGSSRTQPRWPPSSRSSVARC